jgi:hypothetical protein
MPELNDAVEPMPQKLFLIEDLYGVKRLLKGESVGEGVNVLWQGAPEDKYNLNLPDTYDDTCFMVVGGELAVDDEAVDAYKTNLSSDDALRELQTLDGVAIKEIAKSLITAGLATQKLIQNEARKDKLRVKVKPTTKGTVTDV